MKKFRKYGMIPVLAASVLLTGCEKEPEEVPEEEHDHESNVCLAESLHHL